ncbi:MAG: thiamine pyrophosphate-dependent dehydrogenase E1 component subunit alpha [Nocardioidaceae bacterium]
MNAAVSTDELTDWLRMMTLIRGFEERVKTLFSRGLVRGTTHLATGQEAVAVGASAALQPDDWVLGTYRGHHHALARGMSPASAFAEILGRSTGVCRGKGGSMHLTDVSRGVMGSYAIVGAHLPIAVGCAWSSKIQDLGRVAVCFFGDGTTTIGAFHEAVNLAAVWKLPAIFVCENNRYSEYTPIDQVSPVAHAAADRAAAYGIPGIVVDGNDVAAVRDAVDVAADRARRGAGPTIVEAETYRHGGHSRADPAKYRPEQEVEHWLQRDPVAAVRRQLEATAGPGRAEQVETEVADQLDRALEEALAAPEPDLSTLTDDVYARAR